MPKTMTRTGRITISLSLVGLLAAVLVYLYGAHGPFYRTEAAIFPIRFSASQAQRTVFNVDRTEEYMVEIHLKKVFPKDQMERILGDFQAGGKGQIDIAWQVNEGPVPVAKGSSREHRYSPIFGADHWGLTIGSFKAEVGKQYQLAVTTRNLNPEWDEAKPYIEVGLHPAKLEGYLVLQLLGAGLFVVFFIVFSVGLLIAIYRNKKSASNTSYGQPQ